VWLDTRSQTLDHSAVLLFPTEREKMGEESSSSTTEARPLRTAVDDHAAENRPDTNNGEFASALPWEFVATFLPLEDVLSVRLTSKVLRQALTTLVDPETCAAWFSRILKDRTLFYTKAARSWRATASQYDTPPRRTLLQQLFVAHHRSSGDATTTMMTTTPTSSPFETLLRVLRVCHHLPQCAGLGFSERHGRVCVPFVRRKRNGTDGDDGETMVASPILYGECTRANCSTCQFRRAPEEREEGAGGGGAGDDDDANDMDRRESDGSDEESERRGLERVGFIRRRPFRDGLDTNMEGDARVNPWHVSCFPNLPNDLTCPICSVTDHRTLLVTVKAYDTAPGTTGNGSPSGYWLTFTPRKDNEEEGVENADDPFLQVDANEFLHNARRSERAQQGRWRRNLAAEGPRWENQAKHVVCISCTACRQFAIFAPAVLCDDRREGALCEIRNVPIRHQVPGIERISYALVRTQCSEGDCLKAIPCPACIIRADNLVQEGKAFCRLCAPGR
jgi:hypothetical protein